MVQRKGITKNDDNHHPTSNIQHLHLALSPSPEVGANAALSSFATMALWREPLNLVELMRNGGIPGELATSSGITNACQRAGQWQRASALEISNENQQGATCLNMDVMSWCDIGVGGIVLFGFVCIPDFRGNKVNKVFPARFSFHLHHSSYDT